MRIVLFYHSLVSDWNHGNAHFLRGIATELQSRGHDLRIFEPEGGWSRSNLVAEHGAEAETAFHSAYPSLVGQEYRLDTLDLDAALDGAELVIVHEWNDHELVRRIGVHRGERGDYRLLFHDTHHRSVTDAGSMAAYDLSGYDGVLAFGRVIRDLYLREGWTRRAWTWHEAADMRVFNPKSQIAHRKSLDLVWIGNWGDEERTAELHEFLLGPVRDLKLKARAYGVRYPESALQALADAGVEFTGWLANHRVPDVFAQARVTVHVPRRPYVEALPGVPTIRVFEALACGIPLVTAPWQDVEGLFMPGKDYLVARDGAEMRRHLTALLSDSQRAKSQAEHGLATIRARHTCAHRVDELLAIDAELRGAENALEGGACLPA